MSLMETQSLQCPHCGNIQETNLWDSINTQVNPELKEKFLAYEINVFECEGCGEKTFTNTPLFYHDMTQKFCVHFFPAESLEDLNLLKTFNIDGTMKQTEMQKIMFEKFGGNYISKPHYVFDMLEMYRYITFRYRIADIARIA